MFDYLAHLVEPALTRILRRRVRWWETYSAVSFMSFVIVACAVLAFCALAWRVGLSKNTPAFDIDILLALRRLASPPLTAFMKLVTSLGSVKAIVLIGMSFSAFFVLWQRWPLVYGMAATTAGTSLLNLLLKDMFRRPRPTGIAPLVPVSGFSFPSGHAMIAVAMYGYLLFLIIRWVKRGWIRITAVTFMSLLIILIGLSRIYLGVHYPTDVLAGYLAGLAWLICSIGGAPKR